MTNLNPALTLLLFNQKMDHAKADKAAGEAKREHNQFKKHSIHSIIDTAEQHIYEKVRKEVRVEVTRTLLKEFDALIQEKINAAFAEITFNMYSETDMMTRSDYIKVFVEWIKAREEKRRYRTKTVVEEIADPSNE
jgi:ribosomal protein S25